jgi:hypothetical protein
VPDADGELTLRFQDAYDDSGVDRSQIRDRLALSPEQRLQRLDEAIRSVLELREAAKQDRDESARDSRRPR